MRDFTLSRTWHLSVNTSQSQIQSRTSFGSGSGQKFSKLRIPASTGVGAELKDQMNTVM